MAQSSDDMIFEFLFPQSTTVFCRSYLRISASLSTERHSLYKCFVVIQILLLTLNFNAAEREILIAIFLLTFKKLDKIVH